MLEENNNRPSASTPTGEAGRKLSLRRGLEHRPWLLIAMIVIIAALIGWLSYWLLSRPRKSCRLLMTAIRGIVILQI